MCVLVQVAAADGVFSKLTDTSLYTGAHKVQCSGSTEQLLHSTSFGVLLSVPFASPRPPAAPVPVPSCAPPPPIHPNSPPFCLRLVTSDGPPGLPSGGPSCWGTY